MSYLKVNDTDISHLVKGLKIGYETLLAETSGRNANGDTVIDIINRKVKVYVTFRPMFDHEMLEFLNLIQDYVVSLSFRDSKTNQLTTITCYTGTPEPEYYHIGDEVIYKDFSLNFIEL
jgi:hypothetical protein